MLRVNLLPAEFRNVRASYLGDAVEKRILTKLRCRLVAEPRIVVDLDLLQSVSQSTNSGSMQCWRSIDANKACVPIDIWLSEDSSLRLAPIYASVHGQDFVVLGGVEVCKKTADRRLLILVCDECLVRLFGYKSKPLVGQFVSDQGMYDLISGFTYAFSDRDQQGKRQFIPLNDNCIFHCVEPDFET
ncbi:MAG: hypothetical protein WC890_04020 [Candidatus Margulisiibacteriota bacterium]